MFDERSFDYKKEHYKLDHDGKKVWCVHCKKVVEERDNLPDYALFMGCVWIKQNLPCIPYKKRLKVQKENDQ